MHQRVGADFTADDDRYNIVDWQFGDAHPNLYNDYEISPFFAMNLANQLGFDASALKWIYFGEPGTGSPTHTDVANSSAWLLLAQGHKKWRMIQEEGAPKLQAHNRWADLFNIDSTLFPGTSSLSGYETVQRPGEIMWTPSRCIHAVQNLDHTIALTHNYIDLTNLDAVLSDYQPHRADTLPQFNALIEIIESGVRDLHSKNLGMYQHQLLARLKPEILRFKAHSQLFQEAAANSRSQ